jgi:hypothetical protein
VIDTVVEETYWVVQTPTGYLALLDSLNPEANGRWTDAPLARASRFSRPVAEGLAAGSGWRAMPVVARTEVQSLPPPGERSYYTLATYGGEFMLSSRVPLDWPGVVEAAVAREELDSRDSDTPWEPSEILPILNILIELHDLEVVRASRYYHLGWRSETVRRPGE